MLRCGVVGYGYWGVNVARTLSELNGLELYALCEIESERTHNALEVFPSLRIYQDFEDFLGDENIECVFIITPPHTHFALAKQAIESKRHLFVEKPLCMNYADSQRLYDLAHKHNVVLFCDHIFLHAPAVQYLKTHIHEFGNIVSITARRINLGLFQSATDVVWDLAIHDLSIIDYLVGLDVKRVSVFKQKYLHYPNDAFAVLNLELNDGIVAMINVSWLSPIKVREMSIGGSKQTAIYDETRVDKLRIYTSGVVLEENLQTDTLHQAMVKYRLGEVQTPHLSRELALHRSIKAFAHLVYAKSYMIQQASDITSCCTDISTSESMMPSWGEAEYRDHTLRVMAVLERLECAY